VTYEKNCEDRPHLGRHLNLGPPKCKGVLPTWHQPLLYIKVSQEEWARLREDVPYIKVCGYNPKHPCPKLNGYGDNGQRKVWSSGGSTYVSWQVLSKFVLECGDRWQLTLSPKLHMCFLQGMMRCTVSHVTSVLGTLRTTTTWRELFVVQFNGFMSLTSYFDVTYIINITETTYLYSCQF
jgi:hypothetical protein